MKLQSVTVILFLVSSVYVTGVYSALGFSFNMPYWNGPITAAIGSGTAPLVSVVKSANASASADSTGTLAGIVNITEDVITPLNALFAKIKDVSTSNSTDRGGIVTALDTLFENAISAADNASTDAADISSTLRPSVYNGITAALANLNFTLEALQQNASAVINATEAAVSASLAVTASTISKYVTPTMVSQSSSSLVAVRSAITSLAKALQTAVTARTSAINNQASTSQAVTKTLASLNSVQKQFNTAVTNTNSDITKAGNTAVSNVNTAFKQITSSPSSWNNGNIANLTSFINGFGSEVQTNFTEVVSNGITNLTDTTDGSFENTTSTLSQLINEIAVNISETGSISTSKYADRCVTKYISMLQQPSVLNILQQCFQQETTSLSDIVKQTQGIVTKASSDATKSMTQLQQCGSKTGPCVEQILDSLDNQSSRTASILATAGEFASNSLTFTGERLTDCLDALSAAVELRVMTIQTNFSGCLTSGS